MGGNSVSADTTTTSVTSQVATPVQNNTQTSSSIAKQSDDNQVTLSSNSDSSKVDSISDTSKTADNTNTNDNKANNQVTSSNNQNIKEEQSKDNKVVPQTNSDIHNYNGPDASTTGQDYNGIHVSTNIADNSGKGLDASTDANNRSSSSSIIDYGQNKGNVTENASITNTTDKDQNINWEIILPRFNQQNSNMATTESLDQILKDAGVDTSRFKIETWYVNNDKSNINNLRAIHIIGILKAHESLNFKINLQAVTPITNDDLYSTNYDTVGYYYFENAAGTKMDVASAYFRFANKLANNPASLPYVAVYNDGDNKYTVAP